VAAQASFYWHDYETFGRDPGLDRPVQFAGIRTDADLNEIGEPLDILCRLPEDYLPHPGAMMVHGITPQRANAHGLPEPQFIARIHAELARPGTCGVGYNTLRFDDEFTRFCLFRNFYDPYEREWRDGNSRWDLIDVMRMARLLRPEGIEWPDLEGKPSFKLEQLAAANGLLHEKAHDALSDVRATIALARLLRAAQPRLFDWALKARDKTWVLQQLALKEPRAVLHVSSRFSAEQGCGALVLPLAMHPGNRNSVIVCNLTIDPSPLIELDAARIRELLYTRTEDLPTGMGRIPLKEIKANKCPMIAPAEMLAPGIAARAGIDIEACRRNAELLLAAPGLAAKLREVYAAPREEGAVRDPESALYQGFIDDRDKALFPALRAAGEGELRERRFGFRDERLATLLFRYRARNFPGSLSADERAEWEEHIERRRHGEPQHGLLDCHGFALALDEERKKHAADATRLRLLDELASWGASVCAPTVSGTASNVS
jgi:exodeoxyribonuclease-1